MHNGNPSLLKRSLAVNFASSLWSATLGIVMVPLYLRYLGVEAFGLVTFSVVLQSWLALLDFGLSPMLSREMARFRAGSVPAREALSLVRTLEVIFGAIGLTAILALAAGGPVFATHWFNSSKLPVGEVASAVAYMGPVIGFRFATSVYRSALLGLERQLALNVGTIVILTLRYCLVVPLIALYPRLDVFLIYQVCVAIIETFTFRILLIRRLPRDIKPIVAFSLIARRARFSLSVAFTGLVWVFVTQFDKLILSGMLSLETYGYFSLGVILAGGISLISAAIGQTFQPRLTYLAAGRDIASLAAQYHLATQVMVVLVVPVGAVMVFWPELVLYAWTGEAAQSVATPVLRLYAGGNTLLALLIPVAALQIAFGRMGLHVVGNTIFATTLVPLLYWATTRYGAVGAGWVWFGQNAVFCLLWVALVHRYLALPETLDWYIKDTAPPILAALTQAFVLVRIFDYWPPPNRWMALGYCLLAWALCTAVALLTAGRVRKPVLGPFWRSLYVN